MDPTRMFSEENSRYIPKRKPNGLEAANSEISFVVHLDNFVINYESFDIWDSHTYSLIEENSSLVAYEPALIGEKFNKFSEEIPTPIFRA
jgi:hypothetical protein